MVKGRLWVISTVAPLVVLEVKMHLLRKLISIAIVMFVVLIPGILIAKETENTHFSVFYMKVSIHNDDLRKTPFYRNNRIDLALIMWYEAKGEQDFGMRLVGNVVINRLDSKIWGNSVQSVISASGQFQNPYRGSWQSQQLQRLKSDALSNRKVPSEFISAMWIADTLLIEYMTNTREDETRGATHFHRTNIRPANIKQMEHIMTYRKHSFWKLRRTPDKKRL